MGLGRFNVAKMTDNVKEPKEPQLLQQLIPQQLISQQLIPQQPSSSPQQAMFKQYAQPKAPSYAQYFAPYKLDDQGNPLPADQQPSQVDQMVARAQAAYNNINPATLAQLFPALYPGLQQQLGQTDMSSGAGRFLGNNQLLNSVMNPGMSAMNTGMTAPQLNFNAPTTNT